MRGWQCKPRGRCWAGWRGCVTRQQPGGRGGALHLHRGQEPVEQQVGGRSQEPAVNMQQVQHRTISSADALQRELL